MFTPVIVTNAITRFVRANVATGITGAPCRPRWLLVASFNFANGSATVGTTAAVALTVTPGQVVVLQNTGAAAVFLGGSTVTSLGANIGYSLAAGASITLPSVNPQPHALYAICAPGTQTLVYLTSHN